MYGMDQISAKVSGMGESESESKVMIADLQPCVWLPVQKPRVSLSKSLVTDPARAR
jgi:hypothetical protein